MPSSTYTEPILITGDMIATLTGGAYQQGNPGDADFGMVLPGVDAMGTTTDLYRLVWHSNTNSVETNFDNGQFWRLEVYNPAADPDGTPTVGDDGWTTVSGYELMTPKNDLATGIGGGDEYVVFEGGTTPLIYNINGGLPTSPTTLTYLASDQNGDLASGDNDSELDFADAMNAVVCFAAGTLIDTPGGPVPVEDLAPGDLVRTRDGSDRPLRWRSARRIGADALAGRPNLWPVCIAAGALGRNRPESDLLVSPQHRVLLRSGVARRLSGAAEVLVPAIRLVGLPGIAQVCPAEGVSYHHFATDRHDIVLANGVPSETFLPGVQALRALDPAARAEFLALFPDVAQRLPGLRLRAAYPILAGHKARELTRHHSKAARPIRAA